MYAEETVQALNTLVGVNEGAPLYSIITVGNTSYYVSAHLLNFYVVDGDGKFKIGVTARFNDKTFDKMTELHAEMIEVGLRLYGVDLSSKNFDCWGRFHVILPREGRWVSTTLRGLMHGDGGKESRSVRQGETPFDERNLKFRHALQIYDHLRSAERPIFAVEAKAQQTRKRKATVEEKEGDQEEYTPTPKLLRLIKDLQMAYILLNDTKGPADDLRFDVKEIVKKFPNTARLSTLFDISKSEATALMRFAQSGGKT